MRIDVRSLLVSVTGCVLAASAQANPSFVNGLAIDGGLLDVTNVAGANQGRVGFFSDIYYDPARGEWWSLSDRGPGGGTIAYDTRVQRFTLDVDPSSGAISNFQIVQTVKFQAGSASMNGLAPNPTDVLGNAFDPEGIVVNPLNGNFLVSDEYGPSLYEFDRSGQKIRAFTNPSNVVPRNGVSGVPNFADDTGNTAGKRVNRGYEGLAVSPNGQHTFAMLQSAMLDEGAGNGTYSRIVQFDNATGNAVGQYAYRMDTASQGRGISALVAINDHQFMVIERNNRGIGVGANSASADKRVYKIDLTGASDVSAIDLDAPGASFTAVAKSGVFIDLDANTLAALGNTSPEKWEGLAIGPRLDDGSYLILAGTDNDYSATQNAGTAGGASAQFDWRYNFDDLNNIRVAQCDLDSTSNCVSVTNAFSGNAPTFGAAVTDLSGYVLLPGVLHAYKASAADLAGYTQPVPEPQTYAMLLAGLGLLGLAMRRRRS